MAKKNSGSPESLRILASLIAGVFLMTFAWLGFQKVTRALNAGRISYGRIHTWTVYRDTAPGDFWFHVIYYYCAVAMMVAVAIAAFIYVFKRVGGRPEKVTAGQRHRAEREEANRLGITVSDVERDLPEFSHGNRSCELVRGTCARYSLPRHGGARNSWSLLQRTKNEGAQLPDDYLLQGEVSDALRQALTKLATEFSEEYFEFEGTPTEVAVYWEEWGRAEQVKEIHRVLESLAGL